MASRRITKKKLKKELINIEKLTSKAIRMSDTINIITALNHSYMTSYYKLHCLIHASKCNKES